MKKMTEKQRSNLNIILIVLILIELIAIILNFMTLIFIIIILLAICSAIMLTYDLKYDYGRNRRKGTKP